MNLPGSSTTCRPARQFCHIFNLKFRHVSKDDLKYLLGVCSQFMKWLREFVKINNIYFPNIETFFFVLIYNSIDPAGLWENSKFVEDINLKTTQHIILEYFGDPAIQYDMPSHKNSSDGNESTRITTIKSEKEKNNSRKWEEDKQFPEASNRTICGIRKSIVSSIDMLIP